jgi:hypothetical protein
MDLNKNNVNQELPSYIEFEDTKGDENSTKVENVEKVENKDLLKKKIKPPMVRWCVKIPMALKLRLMEKSIERQSPISWIVRKYITDGLDREVSEQSAIVNTKESKESGE